MEYFRNEMLHLHEIKELSDDEIIDVMEFVILLLHILQMEIKMKKGYFSITSTKTEAGSCIIPILPEVRQDLLEEKAYQKEAGLNCQATIDGYTDFIFLNRYGNPYNPYTINWTIKKASLNTMRRK